MVTDLRWVGVLQNVTIAMQLENFYFTPNTKLLLELAGRWVVKILEKCVTQCMNDPSI